jgi:predicted nucleic acid-binding protein
MLILADTGILLRLLDRTDPMHADTRTAVRVLRQRGDAWVTSPQNAAEFWNVCTRPATARGGLGLDVAETDRRLRIIERLIPVFPDAPAAYGHWRCLTVGSSVMGVQSHDARLVAFMEAYGLTRVLTLNPGDFARFPGIVALTPAGVIPASP